MGLHEVSDEFWAFPLSNTSLYSLEKSIQKAFLLYALTHVPEDGLL